MGRRKLCPILFGMNNTAYILLGLAIVFCAADFSFAKAVERGKIVRQWPLHGGLFIAGELVGLLMPISAFSATSLASARGFGLGYLITPWGWTAFFFIWLLAQTFTDYLVHYAEHRFRPLWAFHRIHHSDERMEASTAFRHHPAEVVMALPVVAALAFVLNPPLSVLLAAYIAVTAIDLFNHSRLELPDWLSTALEWVIVTPRLHRVHHSPLARQTDSNFGGTFIFWDRIFGTFRREVPVGIGLDDVNLAGQHSRDFDTLLLEPFKFILRGWKRG